MLKKLLPLLLVLALLPRPARAAQEAPLTLSCPSAVLMEKTTGTILYRCDPHAALPPASVTKVMTMLLVMEAMDSGLLSPEEPVTVSAAAAGMGGSQVYLKQGEQFPAGELLKCVAVVSGNDCAVALAEHLCGSETAFVQRMNDRAAELGMADTVFQNCTGLPAEGHVTSAHDIALMSRELILRHPDIRKYTTIWTDSIRDGSFGLTNTNRLIRFYPGATGLKTGSTDEALYCISATAEREGMELIAVVMRSPTTAQRFQDAQTLLDYGFAHYALVTPQSPQPIPTVEVILGEQDYIQPILSTFDPVLVEKEQKNSVTTRLEVTETVQAPVEQGQILGRLHVYVGEELLRSIPLTAPEGVARLTFPGIFARLLPRLFMAE